MASPWRIREQKRQQLAKMKDKILIKKSQHQSLYHERPVNKRWDWYDHLWEAGVTADDGDEHVGTKLDKWYNHQWDKMMADEQVGMSNNVADDLSVLKRCVPKTLAFAFGLRLRSKTLRFKTRVLGRRLPNHRS